MSRITSVFSFSPELIDMYMVDLWISGLSLNHASLRRIHEMGVDDANLKALIELDTEDHFRLFEELRPSLEDPANTRLFCEIAPGSRQLLFGRFYGFDDVVVRELMGRKLTSRARKDLDEVSEATHILRPSCARQFDNLKRLFDTGDESGFQVTRPHASMSSYLSAEYHLPPGLAQRYSNILWLLHQRFNIHPSKKHTAFLDLPSLEYCAEAMRSAWCVQMGDESECYPFELDPNCVFKLREVKQRLGAVSADSIWAACRFTLEPGRLAKFESRFRAWMRAALTIAGGLAQARWRDFFEDLVVGLVEPLHEASLSGEDFVVVLAQIDQGVAASWPDAWPGWQLLSLGLRPCIIRCLNLAIPLDFRDERGVSEEVFA